MIKNFTTFSFKRIPEKLKEKEYALQMWREVLPILIEEKLIKKQDLPAFIALCVAYHRWQKADEELDKINLVQIANSGYRQIDPAITIAEKMQCAFLKLCTEFGLSPKARILMKIKPEEVEDDDDDGIRQFIRK